MRNHMSGKKILFALAGLTLAAGFWGRVNNGRSAPLAPNPENEEHRPVLVIDRPPVRTIEDGNPTFNALAMDEDQDEVLIGNNNRASMPSILTYHSQFQPTDRVMEPVRRIAGKKANLGSICGLAVSPQYKEIYSVNGESEDLKVFPLEANGDLAASRELDVDHGAGGLFLDAKNNELFITTEHVNKVAVFRREAKGPEAPLRYIQGPHTQLADPHGIYVDDQTSEIFVTNHGNFRLAQTGEKLRGIGDGDIHPLPLEPSTGKFEPPSITVYSRTARGDAQPLRVIQGAHTGLNLPLGIDRDPVSNQLVVANSGDNSVLFFDASASGDVAPVRVIRGKATMLEAPSGVLVDAKHNELWATSWENHVADVFPRAAQGNVKPLRYIRSAPKDAAPASFGVPGTIAWDAKRKEILIAN